MAVWTDRMRPVRRRASHRSIDGRSVGGRNSAKAMLIASVSLLLLWLVWIYGNGLRDPRYFDGWLLAGGMGLQLSFHIAIKTARLSPKVAARWRSMHLLLGYLLIAAFVSHSDFSFPDTGFEWALWLCFVLVTLSGIFGGYLAWSLKDKHEFDDRIRADRIEARRTELVREVEAVVTTSDLNTQALSLPAAPHDDWILDLYSNHLKPFLERPQNFKAHLIGSRRPLLRLTDEIDTLSRYVDQQSQDKLAVIKSLVIEKDRLDFASVYLGLTKGWMFVHVPVTYALFVLSVLHVLVAYSFSSGNW
jgi:hypothetical protein